MTQIELLSGGDRFGCRRDGIFQRFYVGVSLSGGCEAGAKAGEDNESGYCFSSQDIALAGSPKTFVVTPSFSYFSVSRCIAI